MTPGSNPPASDVDAGEPPRKKLYKFVKSNIHMHREPYFLNFEALQQFNLAQVQQDLAKWKVAIKAKRGEAASEEDMDDFEYMKQLARPNPDERRERLGELNHHFGNSPDDPFNSGLYLRLRGTSQDELRTFLMRWLPRRLAYGDDEKTKQKQ
ncbi:hypothetical protein V8E51_018270 [Hyaloscypha variabilis]